MGTHETTNLTATMGEITRKGTPRPERRGQPCKRWPADAERQVLQLCLHDLKPHLPKLNLKKLEYLAQLFNENGFQTINGQPWNVSRLWTFLSKRRRKLINMAKAAHRVSAPDASTVKAAAKGQLPPQTPRAAREKTYTQVAMNGGGDMIRAILTDKNLSAEVRCQWALEYLEKVSARR